MSLVDSNSAAAAEFPDSVPLFEPAIVFALGSGGDSSVAGPRCCGERMADDGGCREGCCDDYHCERCGYRCRVEWPD